MSLKSSDDVIALVNRLSEAMTTQKFSDMMNVQVDDRQLSGTALVDELEKVQVTQLDDWGYHGKEALDILKKAVKVFPEAAVRSRIVAMCDVEETLINKFEIEISKKHGLPLPQSNHGHSHNGQPCHGHGQQQSHGHSHNGQPCHGHGHGPTPQQIQSMQMALAALSPEDQQAMRRIQSMMMSGQPPTDDDRQKAMQIQQHIHAYMATMMTMMGGSNTE